MSERHHDTSFKWLMFFFVCFASTVLAIGVWAFFSYNPYTIKAVGEPHGKGGRDLWQWPEEVISELELKPKQVIADIGAGGGYFSFRIARAEPSVKVYAAEVNKDLVDYLSKRAKEGGIRNVIPFQINRSEPNLPGEIDLALLVDTYHEINNRIEYFEELRSLLRTNGRIAIIDVPPDSPGALEGHTISQAEVMKELTTAGFTLDREFTFLPEQYFLIFKSNSEVRDELKSDALEDQ